MKKTKTYFSIFDKQSKAYINSAMNCKSKKEAINQGIESALSGGDITNPSEIRRMSLKKKEEFLNYERYSLKEHTEKIPHIEKENKGTQRSPFAPWS